MCLTNERALHLLSLDPTINPSVWAESQGMSKPNHQQGQRNHASAKSCRKGPDSWPRCQTNTAPAPGGREEADATICLALRKQNHWIETTSKVNKQAPLLATSLLCPFLTFSCFRLTVPLLIPRPQPLSWLPIRPTPQGGLKGPSPEWALPCFCGPVPTNTSGS